MAHVAKQQDDPVMDYYYNVNLSVGHPSYNHSDDVLFVQWLLHRINTDNRVRVWAPPSADIVMDGWIGPQTIAWIKSYQKAVRDSGAECHVDGRVDRCPGYQSQSAVTKTLYTVHWMNVWLKCDNPLVYQNAGNDPDCPKKLQSALLVNTGKLGTWGNN